MEAAQVSRPLPRYKSHKEVEALKIKRIEIVRFPGATLIPEDDAYAPICVSESYLQKHNPQPGGYYVRYSDGYESFSPAQAFEEGYSILTRLTPYIQQSGWPQTHGIPTTVTFALQSGPIKEVGVNGCQIDDVVRWARDTMEQFGKAFPSRENSLAITKLDEALLWLYERKRLRELRGVEGLNKA